MLCLGKIHENPQSNEAWEQRLEWIESSQSYRNFDRIDGGPTEFEWNIFPGFNTLQFSDQVKSLLYRLGETPETLTGRILFMSMFNDISCGTKTMQRNVWQTLDSYLCMQEDLVKDNVIHWSWFWTEVALYERGQSTRNLWQFGGQDAVGIRWEWMSNFRATTPLSRDQLKSKGHGKLSVHFAADLGAVWINFCNLSLKEGCSELISASNCSVIIKGNVDSAHVAPDGTENTRWKTLNRHLCLSMSYRQFFGSWFSELNGVKQKESV